MLQSTNNNINNLSPNSHLNSGFKLNQVLYQGSAITTLSDVIEKYNPIVPSNIINISNNNQNISNNNDNNNQSNSDNNKPNINDNNKPTINDNLPKNNSNLDSSSTYTTELAESSVSNDKISNSSNEFSSSCSSDSSTYKSSKSSSYIPSETKFYWEYGNTGLKIKEFKKKMKRNLSIMYYIDRLFNEYVDSILTNSYSKLFAPNSNSDYKLKTGNIKGSNGKVTATILHKKLSGNFNVLEAGFITLSDLDIADRDLKRNSIPNLDSILKHTDNIYHIAKIIKIFNLHEKMTIKSNLSNNNMNLENISLGANSYLDDLIKKDKKKKILKSNKRSGFYIKMYNNNGKGFIIDESHNTIYYIAVNINFDSGSINLRYYAFEIIKGIINKI